MLGFLGWPTPAKYENLMHDQANIMSAHAPTPTGIPHLSPSNKMKRKRSDSTQLSPRLHQPPLKRASETVSHVDPQPPDPPNSRLPTHSKSVPVQQETRNPKGEGVARTSQMGFQHSPLDTAPPSILRPARDMDNAGKPQNSNSISQTSRSATTLTVLRHTIQSQFDLEILLKHRELRLIDQELAKCQVALEQLRRCQIIPYPAQSSTVEDMQAVSGGSGPIYNKSVPHPPPWGVADGPYARHYRRWLMPDPAFDDNFTETITLPSPSGKTLPDRPTRGVKADKGVSATHSRSQRGSTGALLDALPHAYRESKQDRGPMIVKRPSDGRMVKLVCLDCRRSNFNSVQGFINHCRIQHGRQFASHNSAIEASGEEIDAESASGVVSEGNVPQGATSVGLVHPLIRSARPPTLEPIALIPRRKKPGSTSLQSPPNDLNPLVVSTLHQNQTNDPKSGNTPSMPFKPSPQTPHLSTYFAKLGRGGDLDDMVVDAKTRPEVDSTQYDDDDGDDFSFEEPDDPGPRSRSTRGVMHGGVRPASSSKSMSMAEDISRIERQPGGPQAPRRVPAPVLPPTYPPAIATATHLHDDQDNSTAYGSTPLNLSPNTTDPHPAPSLVSDDDDYDNTHSESETSSRVAEDDEEDRYMHASLLDQDDLELGETSGINLAHPAKAHGPTAGRHSRRPTTIQDGHEERHVSFASPVRTEGRKSRAPADGK